MAPTTPCHTREKGSWYLFSLCKSFACKDLASSEKGSWYLFRGESPLSGLRWGDAPGPRAYAPISAHISRLLERWRCRATAAQGGRSARGVAGGPPEGPRPARAAGRSGGAERRRPARRHDAVFSLGKVDEKRKLQAPRLAEGDVGEDQPHVERGQGGEASHRGSCQSSPHWGKRCGGVHFRRLTSYRCEIVARWHPGSTGQYALTL